jgi:DNA polymerase III subunit gamma/tau
VFVFATTEPEKVLPTIRSRTHHYPFRLIPPRQLSDYLSQLCALEQVAIEPAALPLVVRAGGGSARDTLSVLDQLMGGAGAAGVTYDLAAALLGFTPETLLDEVVDAFAAVDGAAVFGVVDKVVETGRDPRRFTEDLLRRLRDLVIVAAVPDAPTTGLLDVPQDTGERLVAQAARFGAVELSRAADIVASGLTEMRGATAPRLLLELICARVLLPGADDTSDGVMARLDRIERRLDVSGSVSTPTGRPERPAPAAQASPASAPAAQAAVQAAPAPVAPAPVQATAPAPAAPAPAPVQHGEHEPMFAPPRFDDAPDDLPADEPMPEPEPVEETEAPAAAAPAETAAGSSLSLVDVRRLWPDIVEATKAKRRVTWIHLTQNAQVIAVDAKTLTLGFTNAGAKESFLAGGSDEILRQAAIDVVGAEWKIDAIIDPSAQPDAGRPVVKQSATAPVEQAPAAPSSPPSWAGDDAPSAAPDSPPSWASDEAPAPGSPSGLTAAREALERSREAGPESGTPVDHGALADAAADPDDPAPDTQGMDSTALLQQALGAKIVEEIKHS